MGDLKRDRVDGDGLIKAKVVFSPIKINGHNL